MTKKTKIVLIVLSVMAMMAGVGGFVFGRYWIDNKVPNFTEEYVLYVYPETTVAQVEDSLALRAGTIRPKSLERALKKMEASERMQPGRYVIDASVPSNLKAFFTSSILTVPFLRPANLDSKSANGCVSPDNIFVFVDLN